MIFPVLGLPGAKAANQANHSVIFRSAPVLGLAGGKIIDGSKSRDPLNTGALSVLRPGVLMGKITASGKYAPSILGVTTGTNAQNGTAYTSGGTSIAVSAATAVEIARRVGTSGNLYFVGPPTASGTVAVLGPIAFSAINTTTGVITTATLGADLVIGSLVCAADGTHLPRTIIGDGMGGFGIPVVDPFTQSDIDVPFPEFPIGGTIISANIINWPADASTKTWIFTKLNADGQAHFTGDHNY